LNAVIIAQHRVGGVEIFAPYTKDIIFISALQ